MAAILNSPILVSAMLHKKMSLIHSDLTWWWQLSWILPSWIQLLPSVEFRHLVFLLPDSLKNTLTPIWLWLILIQSHSNSFILTHLDDGSYLEFCHLGFGHLGICHLSLSSQTHTHLPRLVPTICAKTNFTHISLPTICTKKLHSFIQTQLNVGGHVEFWLSWIQPSAFRFCIVEFKHLVIFSWIHSKTL